MTEQQETTCAPDCTDDSMWICTVSVDGTILDERLIDCTNEVAGEAAMREASDAHYQVYERAVTTGHQARMKVFCPGCGGGHLYDTAYGFHNLPPRGKPQMLHLLVQATDEDRATGERGPIITAVACDHECVATPLTHERLKDEDFKHVTCCIPCYARETD